MGIQLYYTKVFILAFLTLLNLFVANIKGRIEYIKKKISKPVNKNNNIPEPSIETLQCPATVSGCLICCYKKNFVLFLKVLFFVFFSTHEIYAI